MNKSEAKGATIMAIALLNKEVADWGISYNLEVSDTGEVTVTEIDPDDDYPSVETFDSYMKAHKHIAMEIMFAREANNP
ncbi:hypothetical protein [Solemya velum gill symbiont]|uniref:hypothetical protein n=1 Tax=Solemya velum gill symbiont TaxID=2340 RepID=UPI000996A345|nr:hypothetical protein [Solemya velum gill symbiont]OOZ43293.1 hypothetical protein BOW37_11590 [Solemya velum gill symbiont]OOZ44287.1 hypothetical protein BOW38_11685 [Solemya velum gill symbiont]OOZ48058.1 hypothetical protein BOW39_12595 [Solemya velum gill symbiont]OOZ49539.1 hypothetical protein BOW40_11625 [Solemya velum gill symbiont]OOZ53078.1 hypothetical protein BOW41_11775 [Solemya velum gill symbiont]